MKKIEGMIVANGAKIGIVAARFNEFIVSKLVSGAEDALLRHSVNPDDISVAGSFRLFSGTCRPRSCPPTYLLHFVLPFLHD